MPTAPKNGTRRPTINDIARLAGVSKKTVSRVINRSPLVQKETRDRIEAVIAEVGFRPDPQARALASRRSHLIGLVYNNPSPQYVVSAQQGILDSIRAPGFELVVHPCDRGAANFIEDVRAFVERQRLAGVVLTPSASEDDSLAAMLRELGCPFVRVASVLLDDEAAMIVTNDAQGAAQAAHRLADMGHERVAHISGPASFRSAHERRTGFQRGLAERGLALDPQYDLEGAYTYESGIACAAELLRRSKPPTAVFAGNDEMAAGVCRAARDAGFDIPHDLSVIGFDDSPLAARLWPAIDSVRLPIREMYRQAADKLVGASIASSPRIEPQLVVRSSVVPPR